MKKNKLTQNEKKILFRADSSSTIGTGHIMRDLVLAEQFKDADIIFATQDLPGNINHKIEENNHTIKILNSNNIEELIDTIKKNSIDMIIIDHYGINHDYEKILKEITGITIFVLDDTYEKHYCDILLNHNIYADSSRYKNLVPENCELRCGAEFTLLREEFFIQKNQVSIHSKEFTTVLLAMGGTDNLNINIKILDILKEFPNFKTHVVTSSANANLTKLKKYVSSNENITLHIDTDKIASLMKNTDLAIVTPSVTLNEVFYMQLPFIAIKTAANQDEMYKYLINNSFTAFEGVEHDIIKESITKIIEQESVLLENFTNLTLDEKKMVLNWRNTTKIKKWMFSQDDITLDEHLNYIKLLETKTDRLYFLVKKASQNIGVIDFTNILSDSCEFGVYANPKLKGMGKYLMSEIITYAFNTLNVKVLKAEVFEQNSKAVALYSKYNFKKVNEKIENNHKLICMELVNENR